MNKILNVLKSILTPKRCDGLNEYLRLEYPHDYEAMKHRECDAIKSHPIYKEFK